MKNRKMHLAISPSRSSERCKRIWLNMIKGCGNSTPPRKNIGVI